LDSPRNGTCNRNGLTNRIDRGIGNTARHVRQNHSFRQEIHRLA
jgi:hypothetical protein